MENAELEVALEELESRLERLRALYEQYFMGIERIEPAIPRKDVDRRIYVLRREKIRNTAKRFKLQTIISRYNTFQQYWQRICREIEQGTYKRHLIKAERIAPGKMLTIAARKRMGKAALEAMAEGVRPDSAPPSAAPASLAPAAPSVAPAPIGGSLATPGSPRLAPPPKPGARPPKPGSATPPLAASSSPLPALAGVPRAPFESLDLDMDFLGDWDPSTAAKPGARRAPETPARPFGKPLARPMSTPNPPPVAAAASNGLKAPPPQPAAATPPLAPLRAAPLAPLRAAPLAPTARIGSVPPRPVSVAPRPAAPPRPPMPARPAPPPADARPLAAPIPGASPPKPPVPAAPRPPPPPIAARPVAPAPVPARPAAPVAANTAAAAAAPPDERVRELHARLVEAKRQTHDPTGVSMEGLAKSMRATEAKLREQHKNRKIDFDVVIKDGKAVLKPIVR